MDDKQDFQNFMQSKNPTNKPGVRRHFGSTIDELTARMEAALEGQKAFDNVWQEHLKGKKAPEYHSPVESHSEVDRRVSAAVADDARTRKQGEELADLSTRRNQAFTESLKEQENKKADSRETYERKIAHSLTSMNLAPEYRTYVPDWAVLRDED